MTAAYDAWLAAEDAMQEAREQLERLAPVVLAELVRADFPAAVRVVFEVEERHDDAHKPYEALDVVGVIDDAGRDLLAHAESASQEPYDGDTDEWSVYAEVLLLPTRKRNPYAREVVVDLPPA